MPKTKFILTIDTEEDNQWSPGLSDSLYNIAQLPSVQKLCEQYHIVPTYLVTYSVAQDPASMQVLRNLHINHRCEIGSHLHPWLTPPYEHPLDRGAYPHTYPSECSYALLQDKLGRLTEAVSAITGKSPVSFRAGRYGLDGKTVVLLDRFSYRVDASVTPLYDWSTRAGTTQGGPCFVQAPFHPYFLDPEDVLNPVAENASRILEVPVTIRRSSDPEQPVWLRPYPWLTSRILLDLCQTEIEQNTPVLHMMFHSSELIVGGSPHTQTQQDVDVIMEKLRDLFMFLNAAGVEPLSLEMFRSLADPS